MMQIFKNSTCISWRSSSISLYSLLNLCGEKEVIKYAKTTLVDVLGRPKLEKGQELREKEKINCIRSRRKKE